MSELKETIEAIAEEEKSELEETAESAEREEEPQRSEQEAYRDPVSHEYKTDMQNWLGINMRKRRNEP